MKKLTKKILEARLNDIMNEPTPEDYERMERAKERAYAEYMRRQSLSVQPKKSKKKSFRYYAMVACAIAIAFLVVPIVYTAFFPVTISNAHSIVRQAGLWLNNTFHLNIEIPEPAMEERFIGASSAAGTYYFSTPEEVSSFIGTSVLALDCNENGLSLESASVDVLNNSAFHVAYSYSYNNKKLTLVLESIPTDMTLAPHINASELLTPAGPVIYWSTTTFHRAIALIDLWNVQLCAEINMDAAPSFFETLHFVN